MNRKPMPPEEQINRLKAMESVCLDALEVNRHEAGQLLKHVGLNHTAIRGVLLLVQSMLIDAEASIDALVNQQGPGSSERMALFHAKAATCRRLKYLIAMQCAFD